MPPTTLEDTTSKQRRARLPAEADSPRRQGRSWLKTIDACSIEPFGNVSSTTSTQTPVRSRSGTNKSGSLSADSIAARGGRLGAEMPCCIFYFMSIGSTGNPRCLFTIPHQPVGAPRPLSPPFQITTSLAKKTSNRGRTTVSLGPTNSDCKHPIQRQLAARRMSSANRYW